MLLRGSNDLGALVRAVAVNVEAPEEPEFRVTLAYISMGLKTNLEILGEYFLT